MRIHLLYLYSVKQVHIITDIVHSIKQFSSQATLKGKEVMFLHFASHTTHCKDR